MTPLIRLAVAALAVTTICPAQRPDTDPSTNREPMRLPNGKLQTDAILKAEHEKSLEEVAQLIKLAGELQQELEKNERFVLSLSSLKKAEEIEKLAKRLRGRIRK